MKALGFFLAIVVASRTQEITSSGQSRLAAASVAASSCLPRLFSSIAAVMCGDIAPAARRDCSAREASFLEQHKGRQ
jgi:hypothetical protein